MALDPPESWEPDACWLDGIRLELLGPIQGPAKLTPFADKVTIGDTSRQSDPILASWVLEDLTGGLGVLNSDPARQPDRYRFGTLWLLHPKEWRLPAGPTSHPTGVPAGTRPRAAATYGATLYVVFDTKIRYPAAGAWTTPGEAGYADLAANPTDTEVLRLGTTDYLVIADGAGLTRFDGTSWARQVGDDVLVPKAQYLVEWGGELYALDLNNRLWHTADGTTWTAGATLAVPAGEVRALDIFFDQDNLPCPHAATRTGLWYYSAADSCWYRTRLRWTRHPAGGDAFAVWHDEAYVSCGLDVYHYTGNAVSPLSLNRDDGLPQDYQGQIRVLAGLSNWLVVGVNSEGVTSGGPTGSAGLGPFDPVRLATVTGLSQLYLWTGSAFQPLWCSGVAGAPLTWLHLSPATGSATLWWAEDTVPQSLDLGNGLVNPREVPDWPYAAAGWLESSRSDTGWAEQQKVAVRTLCRTEDCSATETVTVRFRRNHGAAWTTLGTITTDGLTTWTHEQTAGASDGLPFYDWQYRVEATRGADGTKTPVVIFLKLEFVRVPDARYGYRFTARVTGESGGKTAEEQAALLQAASDAKRLVPFVFRPSDRSPVTHRCLITTFSVQSAAGGLTSQQVQVAVAEV